MFYSCSKLLFYTDANKTTCELAAALKQIAASHNMLREHSWRNLQNIFICKSNINQESIKYCTYNSIKVYKGFPHAVRRGNYFWFQAVFYKISSQPIISKVFIPNSLHCLSIPCRCFTGFVHAYILSDRYEYHFVLKQCCVLPLSNVLIKDGQQVLKEILMSTLTEDISDSEKKSDLSDLLLVLLFEKTNFSSFLQCIVHTLEESHGSRICF